jgi:hypothetical protein
MFQKIALFVVIALGIAHAQAPSISQGHKKPGEPLHYYVSFNGKPKPTGVEMAFHTSEPKPNQAGFQVDFSISEFKEFAPGVAEVNGRIPENAASGTYQLVWVNVTMPPGPSKRYDYPADFKDSIKFDVVNEASVNFPTIKSITPDPPKQ